MFNQKPAEPRLLFQLYGHGHEAGHMQGQAGQSDHGRDPVDFFFCVTSVYDKRRTMMRRLSRGA